MDNVTSVVELIEFLEEGKLNVISGSAILKCQVCLSPDCRSYAIICIKTTEATQNLLTMDRVLLQGSKLMTNHPKWYNNGPASESRRFSEYSETQKRRRREILCQKAWSGRHGAKRGIIQSPIFPYGTKGLFTAGFCKREEVEIR